ncbi:hypothetical protein [Methylobrevis pamukkalensis]|nr:hypothetical protein [Methylobrevis pamukkalensis]
MELKDLLSDPELPKSAAAPFVIADVVPELGLEPVLRADPRRVPDVGNVPGVLGYLNDQARRRKASRFWRRIAAGDTAPVLLAQGDAWFDYPLGHVDLVDMLNLTHNVLVIGSAFALPVDLAEEFGAIYRDLTARGRRPRAFLFSGGADLLFADRFAGLLRPLPEARALGEVVIDQGTLQLRLSAMQAMVERVVRKVHANVPGLPVVVHGYGPFPAGGGWLAAALTAAGARTPALQRKLMTTLCDGTYDMLGRIGNAAGTGAVPGVIVTDHRPLLTEPATWATEIHPTEAAFVAMAKQLGGQLVMAELARNRLS